MFAMKPLLVFAFLFSIQQTWADPVALPGIALPDALFDLREMDMHLHAGLEREVGLNEWLDLAAADGRKVIVLLDHLELYRMTPKEYDAWIGEHKSSPYYPMGAAGHNALMADFDKAAAERKDLIIFKGWEVGEDELDEGLDAEPLKMADVIGFHISPNHRGEAPSGRTLLKRIAQIKKAQEQFPVPMVLFHPFSMRLEHLQRKAQEAGRTIESLSVEECRFFKEAEQEQVIRDLRGTSIYIEMSLGTAGYWDFPRMREALIADIKPLAEAGVPFTVSTDGHSVKAAQKPFTPERYCAPCGITPAHANTLVRELLALKAKRALAEHATPR